MGWEFEHRGWGSFFGGGGGAENETFSQHFSSVFYKTYRFHWPICSSVFCAVLGSESPSRFDRLFGEALTRGCGGEL